MKKVWPFLITVIVSGAVVGGGIYYYLTKFKTVSSLSFYTNTLDLTAFRAQSLIPTGSNMQTGRFQDLGNNWIKFANKEEKYTVEIPDAIEGEASGFNEPIPLVVYQAGTESKSYVVPAYRPVEPWNLLDVSIPKNLERVRVLIDQEYVTSFGNFRLLETADVNSDRELISAAKEFYGKACNFTTVTKTESKQKGTYDIKISITNPNSEGCSYMSKLDADMIAHEYTPDVIKYSPTAKMALFVASSQGCRWVLADNQGTCADSRVFDSFTFTD
jgi:hypothetical protein